MNAYLVLDITIHDLEVFSEYIKLIPAFIDKHGGRYIVRGEVPEVMEGDWQPQRVVIIEFPTKDKAKQFLADPDAQAVFDIRHRSSSSQLILVEGCL